MKKPPPPPAAACAKMQMVTYKTKDKDIRPPPPPQLMHGVDLFEVPEIVSISEKQEELRSQKRPPPQKRTSWFQFKIF